MICLISSSESVSCKMGLFKEIRQKVSHIWREEAAYLREGIYSREGAY